VPSNLNQDQYCSFHMYVLKAPHRHLSKPSFAGDVPKSILIKI